MLRKLGWDIETAHEAKLDGKVKDVNLLIYARGHDRIFLTFDKLDGEEGENVGRELRTNGGNIIQIHGGAEQSKYRAIGKLLFYYPEWYPFQVKCDGVSVISDIKHNCINYPPEGWHHKFHKLDAEQFTAYLKKQKTKLYKRRPRKRKISSEQFRLT
jgi:hypothetical protein